MWLSVKRCTLALTLFACTAAAQQQQTLNSGVYTDEQAKRGQQTYKDRCATCHGEKLGGVAGPPLTGEDFVAGWNRQPLSELFNTIRNTMPQDGPGTLTGSQTADIVAYILQAGAFPAGRTELRANDDALKQIAWPAANAAQARPAS